MELTGEQKKDLFEAALNGAQALTEAADRLPFTHHGERGEGLRKLADEIESRRHENHLERSRARLVASYLREAAWVYLRRENWRQHEERELAWNRRADELASKLSEEGGDCEVSPGLAKLFVVTMKDGRQFTNCGIHGNGGALRYPDDLLRARKMAFDEAYADRHPVIRIYLVEHPFGNRSIYVNRDMIKEIGEP